MDKLRAKLYQVLKHPGFSFNLSLLGSEISACFNISTFSSLLHQRLLFRRNEGFVPLFLLLGQCGGLFHLQRGRKFTKATLHNAWLLPLKLKSSLKKTERDKATINSHLDFFHLLPFLHTLPQEEFSCGQLLVNLHRKSTYLKRTLNCLYMQFSLSGCVCLLYIRNTEILQTCFP